MLHLCPLARKGEGTPANCYASQMISPPQLTQRFDGPRSPPALA